jgi:hypothetical protein
VWGHIFCRFRRGNDEDTQFFEDFWSPQLFSTIIQSAKHSKPPNHDLGCHSSNIVSYLKPRNMKVKNRIMRGKSLPIVGQHFNKQAIVPDFDRSQRKVWFQDTLQSQ